MYEPLLERIQVLERSVLRWRLVSLALAILLFSSLAISGTFGVAMLLGESRMRLMAEQAAREETDVARQQADMAREAEQQARMNAELARQRLEQMKQQVEPKAPDGVDP
jgi:hypothetical protein